MADNRDSVSQSESKKLTENGENEMIMVNLNGLRYVSTLPDVFVCYILNDTFFHVVLFIILYKVFLTLKSVDETLEGPHLNKSNRTVLSSGSVSLSEPPSRNCRICQSCPLILKVRDSVARNTTASYN